jgi:hypothetical protein
VYLDCADATGVVFEVGAFLGLAEVPHLDGAVIATGDQSGLSLVEAHHPNAGFMLTDHRCLVLSKAFVDICELYLYGGMCTCRSFEQVANERSLLVQARQKMDLRCRLSIWYMGSNYCSALLANRRCTSNNLSTEELVPTAK